MLDHLSSEVHMGGVPRTKSGLLALYLALTRGQAAITMFAKRLREGFVAERLLAAPESG